jgi:type IV pilus assembly protein PilX
MDMKAKEMKDGDFMLNKLNMRKNYGAAKQKGLVLFIALIALVAMSLAAAALVRSVDSGVLVAGNLAFKQSAILSAETGFADAYTFISGKTPLVLQANVQGYFATLDETLSLTAESTWTDANSFTVGADPQDLSGNETRYILQRMCRTTGAGDKNNCLVGMGNAPAGSQGAVSEGGGAGGGGFDRPSGSSDAVVYRATIRVAGPKNTVSYLQAFIY